MYIPEFWVGVGVTLLAEFVLCSAGEFRRYARACELYGRCEAWEPDR